MHTSYLVPFVLLSSCVSLSLSTHPADRGAGTADNDRDPKKPSVAGSHLSSSFLHHSRLDGLSLGATESAARETTHPISLPSPFATVTGDHRNDSSVRSVMFGENEEKQEESVMKTKRFSLPTDNSEIVRGNVQTGPHSSPSQTSLSFKKREEEEDRDPDLVVKGDEVEDEDKKPASDESTRRLLYKLTKTNAPTTSGLIPGILLGIYAVFLLCGRPSRSEVETEKREFLKEFPFMSKRYVDVVLHPATPFAAGGASAALLANYAYTRHKANTYDRLMKRSFIDQDLSSGERLKALNELLLFNREYHEQPPIKGIGGLVSAALPFLVAEVGLLTVFDRILGVAEEKQGRLRLRTKLSAGILALFSLYRLGKSLWRRRKYQQKAKELSATKQLTVYTDKTLSLLMKKKKKTTTFPDVGQRKRRQQEEKK